MNLATLVPELKNIASMSVEILGAVSVVATVIARLTPSAKDDAIIEEMDSFFFKAISFLPTIGVNPNTQKLQDALTDAKAQLDAKKAA